MPPSHRFRIRLLVLATAIALNQLALAAEPAPVCPIGVLKCPKKTEDWGKCQRNSLLDFYTPGLPPAGDRSTVETQLSAHKVTAIDKDNYVFEGDVEGRRLDQLLKADHLTYDTQTTDYTADGNVRYQESTLLMAAEHAKGTTLSSTTILDQVRYQMLSQRGNGVASDANVSDPDHALMHDVTYSTCDPDNREWELRARELQIDQETEIGRAHDVSISYHGTRFFWLPYLRFPLNNQRESGVLLPTIGFSSRRGFDFTLPYYLNLAPNYDATLYPRIMTQRGFMLGAEFRYLTDSSKGQIEGTFLPNDNDTDSNRSSLRVRDTTMFSPNWGAAIDINHVSDARYFEDFGDSLTSQATSLLPSSAYLNGRGTWWTASFGADSYQITDPTLSEVFEPYRRLPRATFEGEHALFGPFAAGVKSEYVSFQKDDALEGKRLDVYPYIALPLETAAYFLRPELGWRYTTYDLDRGTDSSLHRNVPIVSVDAGLIFERSINWFGSGHTQTLEPRIYYVRVPYRDQDGLPVFDTQEPSFDFGQLFRSNRFVGADRQMDANNLTLALTSRLIEDASGQEQVSVSIGEIRYFDPQRVQLPGVAARDFSGSDYVGELDIRFNDRWRLKFDQQFNPNSHQTDLSAVSLQHRFGAEGVLNFSYRYRRDFLEQVDVAALYPISPRWSLVGRYNYSLKDREVLETFAGAQYDSCCVATRILLRHYVRTAGGNASNAIYFEFEFKGLGALGQKTENFLRRAILGYQ